MSVCPHGTTGIPVQKLMKFGICLKSVVKIKVFFSVTRITGPLHEDVCEFVTVCGWVMLRMRNVADRICTENQNTHFVFSNFKLYTLWDNIKKYGRAGQTTDGSIIRRMRIALWITKATDIHSEYVIQNAFPRQQWFANVPEWYVTLTYIACLVTFSWIWFHL